MNKKLTIFVTLMVILGVLVGCSRPPAEMAGDEAKEEPQPETEIAAPTTPPEPAEEDVEPAAPSEFKFSTWGDPTFFEDGFNRMKQDYSAYADVEWTFVSGGEGDGDLLSQLRADWIAESWDTMPDAAEMSTSYIPLLAEEGLLVDLTDMVAPYADDISPAVLNGVTYNGKVYALPWMPNTGMIWYNKEVLDEAGINADDIETWDDYMEAGRTIRDYEFSDGVERYIHNADIAWGPGMALQLMLNQECSSYIDPDTGELAIDTDPAFRRAFEWWVDAYEEGILLEVEEWETPWFDALNEGIIASYISANWMDQVIQFDLEDQEGKWRAMPLPAWEPGGSRAAFESGSANVVILNKPGADVDLAWTFFEHSFLNEDVTGDLTSAHALVPAFLPAFDHPYYSGPNDFYGGQELGKLDREIQESASCAFNYTQHYYDITDLVMVEIQEVWAGNKDVDQAIADAADAVRFAIEE